MKALNKVAETALARDSAFAVRSRLGPVVLLFRANDYLLYDFWYSHWFAVPSDDGQVSADGTMTLVMDVEGRAPAAYYCAQLANVTFLGCDSYKTCSDWALGLAADLAVARGHVGLRAATVSVDGEGVLLFATDPALLAAFALVSVFDAGAVLQNLNWCWLTAAGGDAPVKALRSERSYLLPAATFAYDRRLGKCLESAPAENVVGRKDACANLECLERVARNDATCVFDTGQRCCYWSDSRGVALVYESMFPACMAAGEPLEISRVVLLTSDRDGGSAVAEGIQPRQAARMLAKGLAPDGPAWCTPQLFRPAGRMYEEVIRQCLDHARAAVFRWSGGSVQDGVEQVLDPGLWQ